MKNELLKIDNTLKREQILYAKDTIKIVCDSTEQKVNLLKISSLMGHDIEVTEYDAHRNENQKYDDSSRVIIFGVALEISDTDICSESGATNAKRILKKNAEDNDRVETETVILSFQEKAPSVVLIGFKRFKTKPYIPPPTRCHNCQKFGHTHNVCRGKTTCPKCAKNHKYLDCPLVKGGNIEEEIEVKCINCGERHPAAYKGCVEYIKNKHIIEVKTINKISYAAAAAHIRNNTEIKQSTRIESSNPTTTDAASEANVRNPELLENIGIQYNYNHAYNSYCNFPQLTTQRKTNILNNTTTCLPLQHTPKQTLSATSRANLTYHPTNPMRCDTNNASILTEQTTEQPCTDNSRQNEPHQNVDATESILSTIIQLFCNISNIDNIIAIINKILQQLICIQNETLTKNFL